MLNEETAQLVEQYQVRFREMPPVFGFGPAEMTRRLQKALDTGTRMESADQVLAREGITNVVV